MWPESWEALAAVDQTHHYDPQTVPRDDLITREKAFADPDRLLELLHSSETGSVQMASLARQWERKQALTVHLLRQQLEALDTQRLEVGGFFRSWLHSLFGGYCVCKRNYIRKAEKGSNSQ